MRWIRNLAQTLRRTWKERRGPALAAAALLALAAALVLGWIVDDTQGEHELIEALRTQGEALQREAKQGSDETSTDASNPLDKTIDEWAEIASKRTLTREEHDAAFKKLIVMNGTLQNYVGPQTAEALMIYTNLLPDMRHKYDEYKAHFQRMLDRGVVFQDQWDIGHYGGSLKSSIEEARKSHFAKDIFEMHGVSEGSWAELEEAMIEHDLSTWPTIKEQFQHAFATDKGTVNLALDPAAGSIGIARVGDQDAPPFTDEEKYKMSRYGIAPKGYRLRFVNNLWEMKELAPDEVRFFSEKRYVKDLSRNDLNDLLRAIPSLISRPEADDFSDVDWMQIADRYEAALVELASHGYVPEPFANREPSSASPSGVVRSGAAPAASPAPAPRELTAPPVEAQKAQNEAALAKAERKRRFAEAFLNELEKKAAKGKITLKDRSLIAARLRELRILRNPDLLKPPAPPSDEEEDEE